MTYDTYLLVLRLPYVTRITIIDTIILHIHTKNAYYYIPAGAEAAELLGEREHLIFYQLSLYRYIEYPVREYPIMNYPIREFRLCSIRFRVLCEKGLVKQQ
jgi:hypothetical protein